jgi:hypothetical protein
MRCLVFEEMAELLSGLYGEESDESYLCHRGRLQRTNSYCYDKSGSMTNNESNLNSVFVVHS